MPKTQFPTSVRSVSNSVSIRGPRPNLPSTSLENPQSTFPDPKSVIPDPQSQIPKSLIRFRPYQREIFDDHTTGIQILLWARQTGKSFTLAAWAVQRLLTRPGRLVTILSNSKANGIELNRRCAEVCEHFNRAFEQIDLSPDNRFETFNTETRITINGQTGRIKVVAANPRTARGFSGDLILDEFAFHEDAAAIWEAAEPILASNKDFLCRIASTPNGKHNMFYRLCNLGSPTMGSPASPARTSSLASSILRTNPSTLRSNRRQEVLTNNTPSNNSAPSCHDQSSTRADLPNAQCSMLDDQCSIPSHHASQPQISPTNLIPISIVTRTDAWQQGCPVFHPITREPITPDQARALAQNKRAYDQNYECQFEDQNMALLTHELISAAERPNIAAICEQSWTEQAIHFLNPTSCTGRGDESSSCEDPREVQPSNSNSQICHYQLPIPSPSSTSAFSHHPSSILFAGIDVARHHDQTVITILERNGSTYIVRAILRLRDMRLPDQQQQLETILQLPNLKHAKIDMTGLGLGLFEYTHQKFPNKISGLNFSSSIPLFPSVEIRNPPSEIRNQSVRITEHLATKLLQSFEDRALQIPIDQDLRDDLRKPERLVSPSGRVSIAAARDATGHADHFWSLALALDAAQTPVRPPPASAPVYIRNFTGGRAPRRHKLHRS